MLVNPRPHTPSHLHTGFSICRRLGQAKQSEVARLPTTLSATLDERECERVRAPGRQHMHAARMRHLHIEGLRCSQMAVDKKIKQQQQQPHASRVLEKKLQMGAYGLPKSAQTEQGEPSRQCHPLTIVDSMAVKKSGARGRSFSLRQRLRRTCPLLGRNPSRPLDEIMFVLLQRAK